MIHNRVQQTRKAEARDYLGNYYLAESMESADCLECKDPAYVEIYPPRQGMDTIHVCRRCLGQKYLGYLLKCGGAQRMGDNPRLTVWDVDYILSDQPAA